MTPKTPATEPTRSLSLDVLRAVAILLVLGRHQYLPWLDGNPALQNLSAIWFRGGWMGVDLFFVLSGFLVSGLLFREYFLHQEIRLGRFLIRRGLKIYPAFYMLIAATVYYQGLRKGADLPKLLRELVFIQNYSVGLWPHTWSLAVEEHFYLLLALLCAFLLKRQYSGNPFRVVPTVFLSVATLCLLSRYATDEWVKFNFRTHLFHTHLRIDSLLFGVFLSYYYHFRKDSFLKWGRKLYVPLLVVGLLLIVPVFVLTLGRHHFIHTLGFTCLYLGCGFILWAVIVRPIPSNLFTRALAFVGAYSYSIYLWHVPVRRWLSPKLESLAGVPHVSALNLIVYVTVSLVGGILVARLIEFPVLHLRDRIFPSRSRPVQLASAETTDHGQIAGATTKVPAAP